MLYATTRDPYDAFTAYRTLQADQAADGGLYTPYRLPQLEREELRRMAKCSFGQNVARVINIFFAAGLTGWDVDFAIGRAPVVLDGLSPRLLLAECWRNAAGKLSHTVKLLDDKLRTVPAGQEPSGWTRIAVSVAILFGIFGQLLRTQERRLDNPVDQAVTTGDFSRPMAAGYGKHMGLPIGNIICGCNTNGGVWDLLHHGQLSTGDPVISTTTPECDRVVPEKLELLICNTLGSKEVRRFLDCCRKGRLYALEPMPLEVLREGLYAGVISDTRVSTLLPSVYHTYGYLLSPYAALAYGSLMDYRAKTQENRMAVLIADRSPLCDGGYVSQCLGIAEQSLGKLVNRR